MGRRRVKLDDTLALFSFGEDDTVVFNDLYGMPNPPAAPAAMAVPVTPVEVPAAAHIAFADLARWMGRGAAGGAKDRVRRNMDAIECAFRCETDGPVAADQARTLCGFSGWGGLSALFDPANEEWAETRARLQELLPEGEYAQARDSALDAFYTPDWLAALMWRTALRCVPGSGPLHALDLGCATGGLLWHRPETVEATGVEMDAVSARIAGLLARGSSTSIVHANVARTDLADGSWDMVVANVPFAEYTLDYRAGGVQLKLPVHNYMLMRALDALRPGGVAVILTSRYFLDSMDDTLRRIIGGVSETDAGDMSLETRLNGPLKKADAKEKTRLADDRIAEYGDDPLDANSVTSQTRHTVFPARARLLAALRLPAGTFPNTQTVTDLLVLRRLGEGQETETAGGYDPGQWRDADRWQGRDVSVNTLVQQCGALVCAGDAQVGNGRWGDTYEQRWNHDKGQLPDEAARLLDAQLDRCAPTALGERSANPVVCAMDASSTVEDWHIDAQGGAWAWDTGRGQYRIASRPGDKDHDRLVDLIRIQQAARAMFQAQTGQPDGDEVREARARVAAMMDAYADTYQTNGVPARVSDRVSHRLYGDRAGWPMLRALETRDQNGTVTGKANTLTGTGLRRQRTVEHADTAYDAFLACMDRYNTVDMAYIARLTGTSEQDAFRQLQARQVVDRDPISGQILPYEEVYSGDVRGKLDQVRERIRLARVREHDQWMICHGLPSACPGIPYSTEERLYDHVFHGRDPWEYWDPDHEDNNGVAIGNQLNQNPFFLVVGDMLADLLDHADQTGPLTDTPLVRHLRRQADEGQALFLSVAQKTWLLAAVASHPLVDHNDKIQLCQMLLAYEDAVHDAYATLYPDGENGIRIGQILDNPDAATWLAAQETGNTQMCYQAGWPSGRLASLSCDPHAWTPALAA